MCQEYAAYIGEGDAELMQALHGATAGVENEFLLARFNQGTRAEAVRYRRWRAGSQKSHSEYFLFRRHNSPIRWS